MNVRVIFDTNVVVSAILKDRNPEAVILYVVQTPGFQWIASRDIIAEYLDVLRRPKFGLPESTVARWEQTFEAVIAVAGVSDKIDIAVVDVSEKIDFRRDPKDAMFLECAIATGAEYFVTGDNDFEGAYKLLDTTVLSVSQFKSLVCNI